MHRSPQAAAAVIGRGETSVSFLPKDYRLQLSPLPTGDAAKLSVIPVILILHADLQGRPYRIEDFREPLNKVGVLPGVAGLGAFQMSHVWLLNLRTPEAKARLLEAGNLEVKGRFCLVVDPGRRELRIKLHWVMFDVPVDRAGRAFEPFGLVKEITRERWKIDGFVGVESTTLVVRMELNEGVALESLPHQLRVCGGRVLVVVPGRAPICLRLYGAAERDIYVQTVGCPGATSAELSDTRQRRASRRTPAPPGTTPKRSRTTSSSWTSSKLRKRRQRQR
ncbi:unnamed protein product [Ixodes hexagonus]